ncbi:hypothetical protein DM860_003830 [Cuscuta australis]|uniref:Uncharacterized protein n=1 Tax=Cuscuta australis TaxID=267555 RepID=A0A328DLL6_9ASTE|nr:hypothetical protein DM860_003830 [Cuscuta australis]
MGSEHNGFPPPPILAPRPMRKRWIGCCGGGLSCFGKQKGGKRIAPAARMREANQLPNGPQSAPNQTTTIATTTTTGLVALSLLAPPSSPASFSTPSTAQSPNCYSSPGGLASSSSGNMFAIGPYAHETQLVSPPVFSTFTTEPSTAPLTPPPEMSHLTTPSSPDVPYAHFLSSSITAGDRSSWDPSSVPPTQQDFKSSHQDSNFFCPDTFAQFYIDHSSLPHSGGRISVSKESDAAYSDTRNQSKQSTTWCKQQETEEMGEAYRASFGFSADEIVTTTNSKYVEISDAAVLDKVDDDDDEDDDTSLFTITPFASGEQPQEHMMNLSTDKAEKGQKNMATPQYLRASSYRVLGPNSNIPVRKHSRDKSGQNFHGESDEEEEEDGFSSNKMGNSRYGRKHPPGSSSSDAEIDYRRGRRRSSREGKGYFF